MGTPTGSTPIIGNSCDKCDGVLWPALATPRFPVAIVADLEKCPLCPFDPPDGDYFMDQDPGNPCRWTYLDGQYQFLYTIADIGSSFTIVHAPGFAWSYFVGGGAKCANSWNNLNVACGGLTGSINGTVFMGF